MGMVNDVRRDELGRKLEDNVAELLLSRFMKIVCLFLEIDKLLFIGKK